MNTIILDDPMPTLSQIEVTIEVTAAEVLEGKTEIHGSLGHDDECFELVYYSKKLLGGTTEEEKLRIPLKDIQEVKVKKGAVNTKVVLFPKTLSLIREIPGSHSNKLVFKVKRSDRKYVEQFVGSLRRAIFDAAEEGLDSVPFQLEDTNMGLTENFGLLYMEDEFLVFDLQSGLKGVTRWKRQLVKVEPKAINGIRLRHGKLKDTLLIKPKKNKLLQVIPGDHKIEVKLKIKKKHRSEAERLVQRVINWSF